MEKDKGKVTQSMRSSWDEKIKTIQEAREIGIIIIYPDEISFIKNIIKLRENKYDLSTRQALWLNRIFKRIK